MQSGHIACSLQPLDRYRLQFEIGERFLDYCSTTISQSQCSHPVCLFGDGFSHGSDQAWPPEEPLSDSASTSMFGTQGDETVRRICPRHRSCSGDTQPFCRKCCRLGCGLVLDVWAPVLAPRCCDSHGCDETSTARGVPMRTDQWNTAAWHTQNVFSNGQVLLQSALTFRRFRRRCLCVYLGVVYSGLMAFALDHALEVQIHHQ